MDDLTLQELRAFVSSYNEAFSLFPEPGTTVRDVRFEAVLTPPEPATQPSWVWRVSVHGSFETLSATRRQALDVILKKQSVFLLEAMLKKEEAEDARP